MQRLQAFKFELMPKGEQARAMRRFAGACRFVFNKALALQKTKYEQGEQKLGYAGLCKLLTEWRNSTETEWMADAPVHPLQQTLKDLDRAYQNFFAKRAAFPRFKKKGQGDSFRYPDPKQIKLDQANNRLFLPKLGWLRYRNSRAVLGELRNVTVSSSNGKWFVSIQTQREVEQPLPTSTTAVGIDVGITTISQNHALVCIEDLQIKNMSTSAKGTADKPGTKVKQKSGLNRAILDQGWGEFRRQLGYKVPWHGGQLIAVPPHYTSQTCPCCGHVAKDNRQTQSMFVCVLCGYTNHADVVGAINVLAAGHAVLACGEPVQSGCSAKQEPAEAQRSVSRSAVGIPVLSAQAAAFG